MRFKPEDLPDFLAVEDLKASPAHLDLAVRRLAWALEAGGLMSDLPDAGQDVLWQGLEEDVQEDGRVLLALLTAPSPRTWAEWLADDDWSVWTVAEVLGETWAAPVLLALAAHPRWPEALAYDLPETESAAAWEAVSALLAGL